MHVLVYAFDSFRAWKGNRKEVIHRCPLEQLLYQFNIIDKAWQNEAIESAVLIVTTLADSCGQ